MRLLYSVRYAPPLTKHFSFRGGRDLGRAAGKEGWIEDGSIHNRGIRGEDRSPFCISMYT